MCLHTCLEPFTEVGQSGLLAAGIAPGSDTDPVSKKGVKSDGGLLWPLHVPAQLYTYVYMLQRHTLHILKKEMLSLT